MNLKTFLMGILGAIAFTACSSDNPTDNGGGTFPAWSNGDHFVSVSIEMPTASGSRTVGEGDNDSDKYDDGNEWESEVNNVVFFFFDSNDNCVDIQKLGKSEFNTNVEGLTNPDPNIKNWGTVEVRLKAGVEYKKIAAAINTPANDANELKGKIKTLSDLMDRAMDYADEITKDDKKNGMVMSSSVYYSTEKTVKPTEDKKICLVEIREDNKYDSSERPNIDVLISNGTKKYVDVFVERVVARVDVSEPVFEEKNFYISEENGEKQTTIIVFDHVNSKSEEITVRPLVKGMVLNVLTKAAKLIKPISNNQVGYNVGTGEYKSFQWNDPEKKRSYWASTSFEDTGGMSYYSWNNTLDQNLEGLSQYINPNTQDYAPDFGTDGIRVNEGGSRNTKVMVIAELHKYDKNGSHEAIDLVKYGPDYMLSDNLLAYAADMINIAMRNYDWKTTDIEISEESSSDNGDNTPTKLQLTEEELKNVGIVVHNSFLGGSVGVDKNQLKLDLLNSTGGDDWEAAIRKNDNFSVTLNNKDENNNDILNPNLLSLVEKKVKTQIDVALAEVNQPVILYWKGGKTYYFTNIRHQGFYGLVGKSTAVNSTDFLYGVVRNHIYNITLNGLYGLGTPVIDPNKPINPDRPKNERPSYIKARINILPWRVVTNNATIH